METDFIYWRHHTPAGIKVEEVSGGAGRSGRLWREMAMQIYCENGKDGYRQTGHYKNGAPYLEGSNARISVTHTDGMLAVATLPPTPEADLRVFSPRTAMGIDTERADREQVLRVRERFLNEEELKLTANDDVEGNVLAWTAKEAMYKAAMTEEGIDIREQLIITKLPPIHENPALASAGYGSGVIVMADGTEQPMQLFSWRSEEHILTLAFSPACAKARVSGYR